MLRGRGLVWRAQLLVCRILYMETDVSVIEVSINIPTLPVVRCRLVSDFGRLKHSFLNMFKALTGFCVV